MTRFILLTLCVIITSAQLKADEVPDTMAYASGYQQVKEAREQLQLVDAADFNRFLDGLNDGFSRIDFGQDSVAALSYYSGLSVAVFMPISLKSREKEGLEEMMKSLIKGARRSMIEDKALTADTAAAFKLCESVPANADMMDMTAEKRHDFCYAMGLVMPFMIEKEPVSHAGKSYKLNRQIVTEGFIDGIETAFCIPDSAYALGRHLATSICIEKGIDFTNPDACESVKNHSIWFMKGAKAALGFEKGILDENGVERYLNAKLFQTIGEEPRPSTSDANLKPLGSPLRVTPDEPYAVEWTVVMNAVAEVGETPDSVTAPFIDFLVAAGIDSLMSPMAYLVEFSREQCQSDEVTAKFSKLLSTKLPSGYTFFGGVVANDRFLIGIRKTDDYFIAPVREATVRINPFDDRHMPFISFRFPNDAHDSFYRYTEEYMGRYIAVYINGKFVSAPKIVNAIPGGHCTLAGCATVVINNLFASPVQPVEVSDNSND